ncbi:MAG: VCBS repeat-containing protein, partial [Alphaproteobacteria bacterium]|nr:VCBS repeat-containing protein [Alphaproteobacteria bacterium]
VSLSAVIYVGPPSYDWTHFDQTYGDLLNGTAPTLLNGAALTSIQYTPPSVDETDASTIQDWVTHFSANNWLGALFDYTCDEPPNGCSWSAALSKEQAIHAGSTAMKTLITTDIADATANNVAADLNIILPVINNLDPEGGSNQRSSYDSFLSGTNKHLWFYQACSSHGSCSNGTLGGADATWPSYMIDAAPVRNRVFQWFAFLDQIEGELYYDVDYCWAGVGGSPCGSSDPWVSVYSFGGNGDGTLIYPGTPAKIGGTVPVPVPSIRLKLIRDGMQDYEYLSALSNAGEDAFARATAATFITNAYTFSNDPQALLAARGELGDRLHLLALPACRTDGCPHDLNGDGDSDVIFRDAGPTVGMWLLNGTQIAQGAIYNGLPGSWQIIGQRDFDGDGKADLLWRDGAGDVGMWLMNGTQIASSAIIGNVDTRWTVLGTGDFNGDGYADILWRDGTTGTIAVWFMQGAALQGGAVLGVLPGWNILGCDNQGDILLQDGGGDVGIWQTDGTQILAAGALPSVPPRWQFKGFGDFDGEGNIDVLWQDSSTGTIAIWFLNGTTLQSSQTVAAVPASSGWSIAQLGDYNGDGKSDILWINGNGQVGVWLMNGATMQSGALIANVPANWSVQNTND